MSVSKQREQGGGHIRPEVPLQADQEQSCVCDGCGPIRSHGTGHTVVHGVPVVAGQEVADVAQTRRLLEVAVTVDVASEALSHAVVGGHSAVTTTEQQEQTEREHTSMHGLIPA